MASRNNAFSNLGAEFKPKASETKREPAIDPKAIDSIAEEHDFPSRSTAKATKDVSPTRRRRITGRNQQINIKTTAEAIERLYAIADRKRVTLGQVLEDALDALEKAGY
jgi:hypothetical protein